MGDTVVGKAIPESKMSAPDDYSKPIRNHGFLMDG